ncbi:MAG: hypothetical protein MUF54_12275, partial [Polyangiaceae bacterium]|nr:hypothetical protein [Polyangiaceae bacterium]
KTGRDVLRPEMDEPWTIWQQTQLAALERRKPLYYGAILLFTGLAVAATRRRALHQAAMLGLMMIPLFFYPANYYCHYVFLLPLVAADRKDPGHKLFGWVAIVLVAMSALLYLTLSEPQVDVRYTLQSDVILAGLLLVLGPMAYFAWCKPEAAAPPTEPARPLPVASPQKQQDAVLSTFQEQDAPRSAIATRLHRSPSPLAPLPVREAKSRLAT